MLNHWTPREVLHIDIYDHSLSPPFDINFLLIYEVLVSSFLIALPQTFFLKTPPQPFVKIFVILVIWWILDYHSLLNFCPLKLLSG